MKFYILLCVLFIGIGIALSGRNYDRRDDGDDDDDDGDDTSSPSSDECDSDDADRPANCPNAGAGTPTTTQAPPPADQCTRAGFPDWTLTTSSPTCTSDRTCGTGYCGTGGRCCFFTGCIAGYYGVINGAACATDTECTMYVNGYCQVEESRCCYRALIAPVRRTVQRRKLARRKLAERRLEKLAKLLKDLY